MLLIKSVLLIYYAEVRRYFIRIEFKELLVESSTLGTHANSLLLFLSFPAARTAALGASVPRFLRPFKNCPTDPVRRVYFAHLAKQPQQAIQGAAWCAPPEVLPPAPPPTLAPLHESRASGCVQPWCKRARGGPAKKKAMKKP